MTNKELADLIFPDITKTISDYEKMYPSRNLKVGAYVTRFAPSPTGFVHIGHVMQAVTDYVLAKKSGGVYFLRNEDTDTKREVDVAVDKIMDTLKYLDMMPSEFEYKGEITGNYGPYVQSERKEIYHTFIKHLIESGRAYPCFCTKEELDETRTIQEDIKERIGYYGKWARCRDLSIDEVAGRIKNGDSYVIRFKSMGNFNNKFIFNDLVAGEIEFPENDLDIVIMKSDDKLPTYHFAHLVDDYLMHTTHVIRGFEWLPSVPVHVELFEAFGFTPPKYIHSNLLLKQDGTIRRKISKRKDPEALMDYYIEKGYPHLAVIESIMTIINSNYEAWHTANPDKSFMDFDIDPKKMGTTGALYDLEKLNNISREIISKMRAEEVYDNTYNWALKYDKDYACLLEKYKDYSIKIFNIEREQAKPRKDFTYYSEIKSKTWYMYDELYHPKDNDFEYQKITDKEEIRIILDAYLNKYIDLSDKDVWFNNIKIMCDELGYASNMKEYKANPDNYKGSVADVSTVLRVSLTTKSMTPDLYEIMCLLGVDKIKSRYSRI